MTAVRHYCRVALPVPVDTPFDYHWPGPDSPRPGTRVLAPFGARRLVGMVVGSGAPEIDPARIKPLARVLDAEPLFKPAQLALARWCAQYYHHPLGEVIAAMLPAALRRAQAALDRGPRYWQLTAAGAALGSNDLARAPRQAEVLRLLADGAVATAELRSAGIAAAVLGRMRDKALIEPAAAPRGDAKPGPALLAAQAAAVDAIGARLGAFAAFLLDGVTGSGKTEIYLHVIERVLEARRQALVIVPEIGLTPQLSRRFKRRLTGRVVVLHSNLGAGARARAWQAAAAGEVDVVVGTRSAVFTPLARPGLIVVDEEHDLSLKQQDGLRYSARDVAVQRASMLALPVVLGSATPSLESLNNALGGRYHHLRLAARAGAARLPRVELIDQRGHQPPSGLSAPLLGALDEHLKRGEQALIFLNRRGFAPVLMCSACGWYGECSRCDARLTLHLSARLLRCHHCGHEERPPARCPACNSSRLDPLGSGTERLEQALIRACAPHPVLRVDRDATRRRAAFEQILEQVRSGRPCVLVGTQMLAKGHDYPNVTLVGVVNIDQALFSSDFRSTERSAQLLVQVAGRAGRGAKPGRVLVQTRHPEHPLFTRVLATGYGPFARELLRERRAAAYPPFGHLVLVRAEAVKREAAGEFLTAAAAAAGPPDDSVQLFGPMPSPMEKRAGRYRLQLLLASNSRRALHRLLDRWVPRLYQLTQARRVRWSVDVDPQDMF